MGSCGNYTGTVDYDGLNFFFTFIGGELRLIPRPEDRDAVRLEWMCRETSPGRFAYSGDLAVKSPVLVGDCNETQRRIVFISQKGLRIGHINETLLLHLSSFVDTFSIRALEKWTPGMETRWRKWTPELHSADSGGHGPSGVLAPGKG